jgi:hypothetical protein
MSSAAPAPRPSDAPSREPPSDLSDARAPTGRLRSPLQARFLADLPNDPELQRLGHAFERGDYGWVRRQAPLLIARTEEPAVRQAAEDLLERLKPDPLIKYLLLLSLLLLIVVTVFVYNHGHA